ncbi:hypothetical protein C8J55DRAFT_530345 [Lentinula edodes]|uniref:Uncharacterized protein n=1 Tax=Lentinula lateritia TaxID=40482 RepID=A0A9W8ZRZ4_9AGAR|nr:hypothetical protein C8J55DRAFT_530345 [Lentinula edodes]
MLRNSIRESERSRTESPAKHSSYRHAASCCCEILVAGMRQCFNPSATTVMSPNPIQPANGSACGWDDVVHRMSYVAGISDRYHAPRILLYLPIPS